MKSADKPRMDKRQKTLAEHTQKQKDTLIEELAKCPIVQVACERTSIGRATYYKWRSDDSEFRRVSDKAVDEGRKFVNDIAESQMIRKIKEGNMTSIIYWLKNNNPRYTEKRTEEIEPLGVLPPEQAKELIRAMHLMGLNELIKRSKKLEEVFRESEDEVESKPTVGTSKEELKIQPSKKPKRGGVVNLSEFIKKHRKE